MKRKGKGGLKWSPTGQRPVAVWRANPVAMPGEGPKALDRVSQTVKTVLRRKILPLYSIRFQEAVPLKRVVHFHNVTCVLQLNEVLWPSPIRKQIGHFQQNRAGDSFLICIE